MLCRLLRRSRCTRYSSISVHLLKPHPVHLRIDLFLLEHCEALKDSFGVGVEPSPESPLDQKLGYFALDGEVNPDPSALSVVVQMVIVPSEGMFCYIESSFRENKSFLEFLGR
jgi:hypothetical protein